MSREPGGTAALDSLLMHQANSEETRLSALNEAFR